MKSYRGLREITADCVKCFNFSMAILGFVLCGICMMLLPLPAKADGFDYSTWLTGEQAKFPAGGYWNHVGSATDNSDGYTTSPCTLHSASGVDHVYGTGGCTCNHFGDPGADNTAVYPAVWHLSATQCMGFVNKLGYDLFGSTKWSRITTASDSNYVANIRVGDIVRISGHSSFVISKSTDNKITVGECNYVQRTSGQGCLIAWGREIDLSAITGFEYYERAQNYDGIIGGTIVPVQSSAVAQTTEVPTTEAPKTEVPTTEAPETYTGWRLAEDGEHYQYIKKDELITDDWITVSKKKYYVDENGYQVTGLYKVNGKNYYFNDSGVMQKATWITVGGVTYYIGNSGYALKSQWLYKGKVRVYVKSNCAMAKSELVKISGSTYYFNSKGKRSKGFKKYKDKYYYSNSNGIILKKQWITKGKKKYYVDKSGVRAANKLVKISGSRYYFNANGVMQKNKEIEYDGKIYKADKQGRCVFVEYAEEDETETEENTQE